MSAFLVKELVLIELNHAIELCKVQGIPTPNLRRLKQHIEDGRMDWSSEGE